MWMDLFYNEDAYDLDLHNDLVLSYNIGHEYDLGYNLLHAYTHMNIIT